jgi:hypothetical protein
MTWQEPEAEDPQVLVGVGLPGGEEAVREMAAAFADEFAQMGFTRERILGLFESPCYAGAYQAWLCLGAEEVSRLVDESLAVFGRQRVLVRDAEDETPGPPRRVLRVL